MSNLIEKLYSKMEANFTRWDYGFLKLYGGIFGLMVGAYYPTFVKTYLWIFVTAFVVLLLRYCYILFFKKKNLTIPNGEELVQNLNE